jgi:predicted kinase
LKRKEFEMKRVATPEEMNQIRQNIIRNLVDRYGLRYDRKADEFEFSWGRSKKHRFVLWRKDKRLLTTICNAYIEQQEELGVRIDIPPVEELLELAEEAHKNTRARYQSAKMTTQEMVQNKGEIELFRSPEEYVYAFGENTVVFLTGRCGAGKSTLVKQLQKLLAEKSYWNGNVNRFVPTPLTTVTVVDPDDKLTDGEWVGVVPTEKVEPAWRETLKELDAALKKQFGIIVIPDAGDNQAAREAILVAIQKSYISRNIHYAYADCPPLEALARNETRERKVSPEVWQRVNEKVDATFESVCTYLKSAPDRYGRNYTWEKVDVSSPLYNNLEEELYQCSYLSPFGERCRHRAIPRLIDCCREKFAVSRWDGPLRKNQSNFGFLCSTHFPHPYNQVRY